MQLTNISYGDEQFTTGFRVFVDMNSERFRSVFTPTHVVKLSQPLQISDTNVYVTNGSVLGEPDAFIPMPGIIMVNGERIIYYEKNGNRLGRLRRGVGGTGVPSLHLAGSDVEDVGPNRYNNEGQYTLPVIYSVTPVATSVNEGATIRFQINTTNLISGSTLYWTNSGTANTLDFLGGVNSGSFQVTGDYNNGITFVTLSVLADESTEGSETIIFNVRTGSIAGPIVATAEPVTIQDTSIIPEYFIVPRQVNINEGSPIIYDVTTKGIAAGTSLYWTNSGSMQPSNFAIQINSGSLIVSGDYQNGFAYITLNTVRIPGVDQVKTIVLELRTGSVSGPIVQTANVVYVNNVPDPAYTLSMVRTAYNIGGGVNQFIAVGEGEEIRFDLTTIGVPANTTFFYNITGNATTADYGGESLTWGTIKTSGTLFGACANVKFTFIEDISTEGPEDFIFNVYSTRSFDANSFVVGPITVQIQDTSVEPRANVIPNKTTVSENEDIDDDRTVTFSIDTDGIRPGNTIYWRNLGTTTSNDFDNWPATQSLTLYGTYRAGVTNPLQLRLTKDQTPDLLISGQAEEGPETIVIAVYKDNPDVGMPPPAPLAVSSIVTVSDTSRETTTTTTTLSPAAAPPPGTALVNFFNGDFEFTTPETIDSDGVIHIPGWSIYRPGVGNIPGHLRLNGFSNILGWPTPSDSTPAYGSTPTPYGDQDAPLGFNFNYSIVPNTTAEFGGANAVRLFSSGTSVSFGIVRGPYLIADNPIICNVGDRVVFSWKAEAGGDDYDVFAYLLDISNGNTIQLLDSSSYSYGSTFTPWIRVEYVIQPGETGTYRFIFVSGSQDASGGTWLGASLYLDNIDKISAAPPPDPWTVNVNAPTTKPGGSPFAFSWTAPASAVGSTNAWFIVVPGTQTAFSGAGIALSNLGSTNNLITSSTSGVISIPTQEISGAPESFQLIITNASIDGTVLVRSSVCTLDPAVVSNTLSPSCVTGDVITRTITGSLSGGSVWGSNPYTDDSDWTKAAVHSGLITPGQTAVIRFTVNGYQNGGFTGTTANGVTTTPWTTGWCSIQLSLG